MRRAARIDANQPDIVAVLRACGCSVQSLAQLGNDCPDLLVGARGVNFVLEIKNPQRGKRTAEQHDDWHARWRGQSAVVWTPDEALAAVGMIL